MNQIHIKQLKLYSVVRYFIITCTLSPNCKVALIFLCFLIVTCTNSLVWHSCHNPAAFAFLATKREGGGTERGEKMGAGEEGALRSGPDYMREIIGVTVHVRERLSGPFDPSVA